MTTTLTHTRLDGTRPSKRHTRSALHITPREFPHKIANCKCGECTAYRTMESPTLAGWTFDECQGFTCHKCNKAKPAARATEPETIERRKKTENEMLRERFAAYVRKTRELPPVYMLAAKFGIDRKTVARWLKALK